MKTIKLTILAYETPVTYAYLTGMKVAGYQPEKIIDLRLVPKRDETQYFVKIFGIKAAAYTFNRIQRLRIRSKINHELSKTLLRNIPIQPDYFSDIDYRTYTADVQRIYAYGLDDPRLIEAIASQEATTFLYTAGGIMPKTVLDIPGKKFIHIHPGIVPYVKGSDGFFWSLLTRGRPGMSCFYMNSGIDTGEILMTREFECPEFDILSTDRSYNALYQAILMFYDPILRTQLLIDVIQKYENNPTMSDLPRVFQDQDEGRTYFTMHTRLRNRVIDQLLR